MKIVLDTNVLISGIFFSGPPYQILKAWQEGEFEITISEDILIEATRIIVAALDAARLWARPSPGPVALKHCKSLSMLIS